MNHSLVAQGTHYSPYNPYNPYNPGPRASFQ